MKFSLKPLASDIFICVYAIGSLFVRFKLELKTAISPVHSIVMGVCFLTIIWALIKLKVLNPTGFGLFNFKNTKQ